VVQNRFFVSLERRNRLGLTQKKLARRTDVPLSTIQAMEQEKVSTIRLETARRLARVLGTTIDEMAEEAREGQVMGAVA
jgi:DNA-binding XRE family transcriptional regulator